MKLSIKMAAVALTGALVGCMPSGSSDTSTSSGGTSGNNNGGSSGTSGTTSSRSSTGGGSGNSGGGSGNSGGNSSRASSGGGSGNSSSRCGVKPENAMCLGDAECQCGLTCEAGQCRRSCTTPDTQDNCGVGSLCIAVDATTNVCVQQVGRDQPCADALCQDPFQCAVAVFDDMGEPDLNYAVCQQDCAYGADMEGCTSPDECLPSTIDGYLTIQATADGGRVNCDPDAGSACNSAEGFECLALTAGNLCSRRIASCGTPVPLSKVREAGDGGIIDIDLETEICNYASPLVDQGGNEVVGGSRFCDTYRELNSPPEVLCFPFSPMQLGAAAGYCLGLCGNFNDDGTPAPDDDCPTGYHCGNPGSLAVYYNIATTNNGTMRVSCTDTPDCAAYPGFECIEFTIGKFCGTPSKQCVFGDPPPVTSSSAGASSMAGATSGMAATSGTTASSTMGTASSM